MVYATLRIWLWLLILGLACVMAAAVTITGLIDGVRSHDVTVRILLQQRAAVSRYLIAVREGTDPAYIQFGQTGLIEFVARNQRLAELTERLAYDDQHRVLSLVKDSKEIAEYCQHATPETDQTEFVITSLRCLNVMDIVASDLERTADEMVNIRHIFWPVLLIVAAWVVAIVTLYWAIYRLTYGYYLFMRDLS